MALVLFAILFLFGAIGMERRRGMVFGGITGALLFIWTFPLVIRGASSSSIVYVLLEVGALLIAFLVLSMLSFFTGRWARSLFVRVKVLLSH